MAIENLTLADLRQTALVYVGESDTQNHFGSRMNLWVNEGVRKMYAGSMGVEDLYTTTLTVGQRSYPMPAGFLYEKMVLVDNSQMEFRTTADLDYYAAGNSRPTWYTFWQKPNTQLFLGPQPPDSAYSMQIFYYRTPSELVADTDVPELPPQWRLAPAKWAAAQAMLADGLLQQAQALMSDFAVDQNSFLEFLTDESRNNYLTVSYFAEY
jgi:hypothetical protein